MFPLRYLKAPPTTFVMQFKDGRVTRRGPGLSFFYWAPTSTLVAVPIASADLPFAFTEATADFQTVTVQGQLTYRVMDPVRLSELLDYSLRPDGEHASEDPQQLGERLLAALHTRVRATLSRLPLGEALAASELVQRDVLAALRAAEEVLALGVEVLGLAVLAIRPTPETAKALEAETREALQRRSDEAIYARRRAAVEQERSIKESELETERAVEEKRRQIREAQLQAEIALEQQRAALVEQKVDNDRKEADSRAYALKASLEPVQSLDWRKLMMLAGANGDARSAIALAFQELAGNAQKIGELNVSPELLTALVGRK